jgi:hypothetical protein
MSDPCGDTTQYRYLDTFEDVIAALGGVVEVSKLTERSKSAVCNWRNTGGKFPAALHPRMARALREKNFIAPKRLWTFIPEVPGTEEAPIVEIAS